ncbi:MAG: MBL fold metallo-hydrolase [Pseudomonadales bacterium]|nr:MBL fold metallo-hydrolase [Pseudomonadales bacterium]
MAGAALPLGGIRPLFAQAQTLKPVQLNAKVLFVQGPDSNVLVVDGSEGLILVDGGLADEFDALQGVIAQHFPGRPYRALFNTHWHREQTGANLPLGAQGVEIIAHENTKLWESTEIWQRWSGLTFAPLPETALPKTTVFEDGALPLGDRLVQYGYMRESHTDGDIWVYFEDENILVTGGLVSNGRWPEIDWWTGGFIGGMLDSFVSLMSVPDANTKIVPAYGNIMTLQELRAQNQMYLTVFDRIHASFIRSDTLEELLESKPTAEFDAAMGDPTRFLTLAFQSIQGHVRDPQNDRFLNIP